MRILLDENLDWRLKRDLPGHEVKSVPLIGWAGIENGELLKRAEDQFDVLITMDSRNGPRIEYSGFKTCCCRSESSEQHALRYAAIDARGSRTFSDDQSGECNHYSHRKLKKSVLISGYFVTFIPSSLTRKAQLQSAALSQQTPNAERPTFNVQFVSASAKSV